MRTRLVVGASCWLFGFVVACGGSAPSDLFGDLPQDTPEGGASKSDASGSSQHDAGTGGGHSDPDAAPSPVDAQADATLDATLDAPPDAPAIFDASPVDAAPDVTPPPTKAKVTCGVTTDGRKMACGAGQECCNDSRQFPAFTCPPPGACSTTPVLCGSAAECDPGQVCCGTYNAQGAFYERILCYSSGCPAPAAGFTYPRFCTFNPGECPLGTTCQPSPVLLGYATCQ